MQSGQPTFSPDCSATRGNDMFYIVVKYQGNIETIDEIEDLDVAKYYCGEYELAYGQGWEVWVSLAEDGPPMEEQL